MNIQESFAAERSVKPPKSGLAAWITKRRWFVLIVIVPTILAAFYYGLVAPDIYVSEARFVIKSPDEKRPQLSSLANLIQTTGLSSGQEQANEILEFARSRDALRALDRGGEFQARFTEVADPFSRFPGPFNAGSFEDLFEYYGDVVEANQDSESGTAILKVEAFTPDDAYAINRDLLELSERMVNRLNARAQEQAIAEAQRQVELAMERAKGARVALTDYRNSQQLIDPEEQAVGALEISNTLIATRAALQAQLDQMQRTTPNNPSLPALRNRINAISAQITAQDRRVVGPGQGIASKLGGYEELFVEQEFATQNLNAAQATLVQARNEAVRQQFYLERIVDANRPDAPLLPNRLLSIIVVAAVLTCLYFIGWMLIVGILEHAPDD